MNQTRHHFFPTGFWGPLLVFVRLASTGFGEWFVQPLPAPPAREPQAVLIVADEADGPQTDAPRTVELLGAGDEWHACGRAAPGTAISLQYSAADGRRLTLPIRRTMTGEVTRIYDVVLALDASLSMRVNDPNDLRLAALHRFLALAREYQSIRSFSLVVFRRDAQVIVEGASPMDIDDEWQDALTRRLQPRGGTSFDVPFTVIDQLVARLPDPESAERAVIFLSDGEPLGRYQEGHRELVRHGCPIYTIGLTDEADGELLGRIATESGGLLFEAPTADGLEDIFADIFRVLSFPEDVVRTTVTVAGQRTLDLVVDPGMRHATLHVAAASGVVEAGFDPSVPAVAVSAGEIRSQRVSDSPAGKRRLTLRGDGRASLRLQADTPHGLRSLGVPSTAEVGTPFTLAVWLTADETVDDIELDCRVRTPSGRIRPWPVQANAFGLFLGEWSATEEAGAYEVEVVLRGRYQGWPLERRRSVVFQRAGRRGPAPPPSAKATVDVPFSPSAPVSDRRLAPASSHPDFVPPAMASSLWTSLDEIVIDLPPGGRTTRTLAFQLTGAQKRSPTATVHWPERDGLEVSGDMRPGVGGQGTMELSVSATPSAAGVVGHGIVRLAGGEHRRDVALEVRVARPTLRGELEPFVASQTANGRQARAELRLWLDGAGVCEARIAASHDELAALPRTQQLTSTPLVLPLVLPLPSASPRTWVGEVTVDGPGLAPLFLPYSFTLAAEPVAAGGSPGVGGWWLWLLLALALFLALGLLVAGFRGDRRAWFVLSSAAAHAVILLLVTPSSRWREMADQLSGTITVSGTLAVIEETIAAEASPLPPSEAQAEASASDKSATEMPPKAEAVDSDLSPSVVEVASESPAAAPAPPADVERHDWQPTAIPENEPPPPSKRLAESPPSNARQAVTASLEPLPGVKRPSTSQRALDVVADSAPPPATSPTVDRAAIPEPPTPSPAERGELAAAPARVGARRRADSSAIAIEQPASSAGVDRMGAADGLRPTSASPTGDGLEIGGLPALSTALPMVSAAPAAPVAAPTPTLPEVDSAPLGDAVGRRGVVAVIASAAPTPAATSPPFAEEGKDLSSADPVASRSVPPAEVVMPSAADARPTPLTSRPAPRPVAQDANAFALGEPNRMAKPGRRMSAPARPVAAAIASASAGALPHAGVLPPVVEPVGSRVTPMAPPGLPTRDSPTALGGIAPAAKPGPETPLPPPSARSLALLAPPRSRKASPPGRSGGPAPSLGRQAPSAPVASPASLPAGAPPAPLPYTLAPPLADPVLHGHPRSDMLAEFQEGAAGQWRRTFANLKHSGDWEANPSAMLHLAHEYERRTGSVFPFGSRVVTASDPDMRQAPFLFMSGHVSFAFDEREAEALREYLQSGGYLWINDSTDIGDDVFDTAVRREMGKLFPDGELRPIPMDHPIFSGPYDLSGGFRSFRVPPGDKYRTDHLDGLWVDGRLAVVYTRNDYGDGLEIDLQTAPAKVSLTDLAAIEMQEASLQMGINLANYFIFQGRSTRARLAGSLPPSPANLPDDLPGPLAPSSLLLEPGLWHSPETDSPDYLTLKTVAPAEPPRQGLSVVFTGGGKTYHPWRSKAIVQRQGDLPVDRQTVVVLDVYSRLAAGGRLALAFAGEGPISYIETQAMFIHPGDNRNLVFDLRQPIFKTEQSDWRVGVDLPADFRPHTFFLLVYPQGPDGAVECYNLRLAQKK